MNSLPFQRRRVFRIEGLLSVRDEGALAMLWTVAKEAAGNWSSHKDSRQGAALAYYSVFSLGPIIVIAIAIAGNANDNRSMPANLSLATVTRISSSSFI
jgi:uncharacterized BrkB/YihY/UPF0761 family membrane protein